MSNKIKLMTFLNRPTAVVKPRLTRTFDKGKAVNIGTKIFALVVDGRRVGVVTWSKPPSMACANAQNELDGDHGRDGGKGDGPNALPTVGAVYGCGLIQRAVNPGDGMAR